jgi:hypothetical protein
MQASVFPGRFTEAPFYDTSQSLHGRKKPDRLSTGGSIKSVLLYLTRTPMCHIMPRIRKPDSDLDRVIWEGGAGGANYRSVPYHRARTQGACRSCWTSTFLLVHCFVFDVTPPGNWVFDLPPSTMSQAHQVSGS